MRRSPLAPALIALLAIAPGRACDAAMPQEPNFDPGHSLLSRIAEAYRALPGYADEGSMTLAFTVAGQDQSQQIAKPFAFARPGRLAVAQEPAAFHLDGLRQVSAIAGLYLVSEAPEALTDAVLARDPAAAYIFGGITGIPSMTLFRLLTSDDPYRAILQGVERLEREPERTIDGAEYRSLKIVPQAGPSVRLLVDPTTYLVRRIEILPSEEALPGELEVREISWSSGAISTEVPPDDRFTYTPREGSRRVESLAALMAGPDGEEPGARLLGKPAPDFTLELLGPRETIERVSRADLADKVVLIDVWATWCAPCGPELQAIDALIDRFADSDAADRIRVISLNIDAPEPGDDQIEAAPDDPRDEIRTLVRRDLDGRGLRLDRPPMARVAIDPSGRAVQALDIQAIPMLILIDPEGIVRAVHVGAPPRVVGELVPTIEAMLDAPSAAGPDR